MLFFFPQGVLDEILNLIESVSEGFPSYFFNIKPTLNDSKGLENNLHYDEGPGTFFTVTTRSQSLAVVNFNMFYKRVILWKQGLHQRTDNCRVFKFSGPD